MPQLPKLESLFISSSHPEEDVKYKDFYGKIIQGAPTLKTVLPGTVCPWMTLCIIPDPKYYKLLDRLDLSINSVEEEARFIQIAKASPALEILHLQYHQSD